ncbi:MAG: hypothetical protein FRX49_01059 [Trebouxia sp. A1-2]|nr:MAG: hypothetical protein FRX49_01059 [Trebouxia sp. A1-2]
MIVPQGSSFRTWTSLKEQARRASASSSKSSILNSLIATVILTAEVTCGDQDALTERSSLKLAPVGQRQRLQTEALKRQTEALQRQTEALERQTEALERQTALSVQTHGLSLNFLLLCNAGAHSELFGSSIKTRLCARRWHGVERVIMRLHT